MTINREDVVVELLNAPSPLLSHNKGNRRYRLRCWARQRGIEVTGWEMNEAARRFREIRTLGPEVAGQQSEDRRRRWAES